MSDHALNLIETIIVGALLMVMAATLPVWLPFFVITILFRALIRRLKK